MASGTLILAGTDLGNRADIPARSLEALRAADLLIFEGARNARAFLKAAGVHRDFLCFSEHKEKDALTEAREALRQNKSVLYMSDQGMPNLADPGAELLELAYGLGASIRIVPGPSAITTALAACPFPTEPFHYAGFLPREQAERRKALHRLSSINCALVLLDTPYRLTQLLEDATQTLGGRPSLLALDISGPSESFIFAPLDRQKAPAGKLNFVLVIALMDSKRRV